MAVLPETDRAHVWQHQKYELFGLIASHRARKLG